MITEAGVLLVGAVVGVVPALAEELLVFVVVLVVVEPPQAASSNIIRRLLKGKRMRFTNMSCSPSNNVIILFCLLMAD